jgi:hypothetical protein
MHFFKLNVLFTVFAFGVGNSAVASTETVETNFKQCNNADFEDYKRRRPETVSEMIQTRSVLDCARKCSQQGRCSAVYACRSGRSKGQCQMMFDLTEFENPACDSNLKIGSNPVLFSSR